MPEMTVSDAAPGAAPGPQAAERTAHRAPDRHPETLRSLLAPLSRGRIKHPQKIHPQMCIVVCAFFGVFGCFWLFRGPLLDPGCVASCFSKNRRVGGVLCGPGSPLPPLVVFLLSSLPRCPVVVLLPPPSSPLRPPPYCSALCLLATHE